MCSNPHYYRSPMPMWLDWHRRVMIPRVLLVSATDLTSWTEERGLACQQLPSTPPTTTWNYAIWEAKKKIYPHKIPRVDMYEYMCVYTYGWYTHIIGNSSFIYSETKLAAELLYYFQISFSSSCYLWISIPFNLLYWEIVMEN